MALRLAADADWRRLVDDPDTGRAIACPVEPTTHRKRYELLRARPTRLDKHRSVIRCARICGNHP